MKFRKPRFLIPELHLTLDIIGAVVWGVKKRRNDDVGER